MDSNRHILEQTLYLFSLFPLSRITTRPSTPKTIQTTKKRRRRRRRRDEDDDDDNDDDDDDDATDDVSKSKPQKMGNFDCCAKTTKRETNAR